MSQEDDRPERTARDLVASLGEPEEHLDFDAHLAPYADGTLGAAEREIVESHIEDCAMCRGELEDLRRHAGSMRPAVPLRTMALAASLLVVATAAVVLTVSRERVGPAAGPAADQPASRRRAYANPEWTRLVEQSLGTGRLPSSLIAPPGRSSDDTLRGGAAPAAAMKPSGLVVETTRPTLEWPPAAGAAYEVVIVSGDEEVAHSNRLDAPRWTVDRDLARGRTYAWQVEVATKSGKILLPSLPVQPPLFRILGAREHEELEQARAQHPRDALLLAVLSARYGLHDDARTYLQKLASSPDPRVQRLLQEGSPSNTNAAQ